MHNKVVSVGLIYQDVNGSTLSGKIIYGSLLMEAKDLLDEITLE